MKASLTVVLLSAVVLIAGCHQVPENPTAAAAAQSEDDIIKAFNKTVRDVVPAHLDQRDRHTAKKVAPPCEWIKRYVESKEDYGIDIRKTDSIVSPYVGVAEFHVVHYFTSCHKTQEEAEKDDTFKSGASELHRYTFAFQGGEWVPKVQEVRDGSEWAECTENEGMCIP